MKVGLQLPRFHFEGGPARLSEHLAAIARSAEDAGFSSLWVMDHFFQIPMVGPAQEEMLEGWGALHFLAALTERIELGTLVTGVTYRPPGVLIKQASTLDVLSGGRAWLGIGAAWFEREHLGLGVPFPPLSERFERLEEALQIAKQMWSGHDGPYHGDHYRLEETLCVPQPLREPHPPILIGGMGERKTLRLVARYADACNLFVHAGLDVLEAKLDVLRRHCDAEGRDYDAIERTTLGTVDLAKTKPDDVVRQLGNLAELGIQHAIVNLPDPERLEPLEVFGKQIIPELGELDR